MTHPKSRQRILECAYEILMEKQNPEEVTIREIAKRAEVGIGLINYHFKTKDMLLMEAVGQTLARTAEKWQAMAENPDTDPRKGLRAMLTQLVEQGASQMFLIKMASKFELTEGGMTTPEFILPYVKRISGKDEMQSRILALSIISGLQTAVLREEALIDYVGIDLKKKVGREAYVEAVIGSISKEGK